MGASASKPAETKVFTPETPVDFSPEFLNQLDNSEEVCELHKTNENTNE